jgi:TonB-linked SusC/RagA family outer membrane protein
MKLKIFVLLLLLIDGNSLLAQRTIKGIVVDAQTGGPISDATIQSLKTKRLSLSLRDGTFSIQVGATADSLIISHIGFQSARQSLYISDTQRVYKVVMEPISTALREVTVSTGYQNLPKERATGSFTQLNTHLLNEQISTDILSRLEYTTSGLTFNRTTGPAPKIQIRGLSTINGPTAPLIVLDNFPYDGDLNNINPNDVESITILKDAAAASIWGTRAGNGVIVITTKKSLYNQPLTIDLNANTSIGSKPDLSYIKQMASDDYINMEQLLFNNGFYDSKIVNSAHPSLSPVIEILAAKRNGSLSATVADAQINALRGLDVRDDFNRYCYQQSKNQQYAITIKGGSAQQSWLFSGGYDNNMNDIAAGYERLNLHYQQLLRPIKGLQLGTSLFYTQTSTTAGKPGYGDIQSSGGYLCPYAQLADAGGKALPVAKDYSLSYLSGLSGKGLLDWKYYPLDDVTQINNQTNLEDMIVGASADYGLFSFLHFGLQYQYERQDSHTVNLQGAGSYAARSLVNRFTQIDATGKVIRIVPAGGLENSGERLVESHNLRSQFSFNQNWGKNAVNAITGAEIRQVNTTGSANTLYGFNPDNLNFGNVDLTNTYPDYVSGTAVFIPDNKGLTDLRNRFISVFANASYTYDDKYTFSASARRDASNLFGVNINNKWNPLGSAGIAWDISKESFYKSDFLSELRIRATYGVSGNVDLSRTAVTTISYLGNSPYTQTPQAVYNAYANPDLKWETSAMMNIGMDFSTRGRRVSGSIEYYQKNGKDLFGLAPLDYTTGIDYTIIKNVGSMKAAGLDFVLNTMNTVGKLKWTTRLNISFYSDKITAYYQPEQPGNIYVGSFSTINGVVGKPVYSVYSFKSAGLDPLNGNPRGYVNGQLNEDYNALYYNATLSDLQFNGSALPTRFGTFGNTFTYDNFSLTIAATFKLGYYFRRTSVNYAALFNNGNGNADYALRWQKPGDELHTSVPSMVYPDISERDGFYAGSENLVEKGDHVRLQYINLGYDFNSVKYPRLPFKTLSLYANISNIGIIWRANKAQVDPDYYYAYNTLLPPLTIAFGLKTSF